MAEISSTGIGNAVNDALKKLGGATKTAGKASPTVGGLTKSEANLADQISLSAATTKSLEQLKDLDRQLTRFLDVLKGRRSVSSVLRQIDSEQGLKGVIAGTSRSAALNLTQLKSVKDTTSLATEITDEGTLDLVLTKTRDTLSQTNFTLSSQSSAYLGTLG